MNYLQDKNRLENRNCDRWLLSDIANLSFCYRSVINLYGKGIDPYS